MIGVERVESRRKAKAMKRIIDNGVAGRIMVAWYYTEMLVERLQSVLIVKRCWLDSVAAGRRRRLLRLEIMNGRSTLVENGHRMCGSIGHQVWIRIVF